MSTKIWQIRCPDCGGILVESEDSRELLGKEYMCDGPHDEVVMFFGKLIHISHRIKEEEGLIKYNKLVRDRIPEIIKADGVDYKTRIAKDDKEYENLLLKKLQEEVDEFKREPSAEEIADVLEVIEGIARIKGISLDEIKQKKLEKRKNRGSFTKRIVLEWTKEKETIIERDGSHVHLNMGNTEKLRSDFKTSGSK
jgi:predicted house-cleaning noncanonical NTP pyrophosphatase (MazG superfamily)